jgi:hypothetical protein
MWHTTLWELNCSRLKLVLQRSLATQSQITRTHTAVDPTLASLTLFRKVIFLESGQCSNRWDSRFACFHRHWCPLKKFILKSHPFLLYDLCGCACQRLHPLDVLIPFPFSVKLQAEGLSHFLLHC